jgi:hypothetical protein
MTLLHQQPQGIGLPALKYRPVAQDAKPEPTRCSGITGGVASTEICTILTV